MNQIFDQTKSYRERSEFIEHVSKPGNARFVSTNNQVFYPERACFSDARIVHLIRHPKDLIVSGYFYHKRGAEEWVSDWDISHRLACIYLRELRQVLNNDEKVFIQSSPTMQAILEKLEFSKGMMLEIVWRKFAMEFNPVPFYQHPRFASFKFENIVPGPLGELEKICRAWQLDDNETAYYLERCKQFLSQPSDHVRDSSSYQYKQYFDAELTRYFTEQFRGLEADLDYPS